MSGAREEVERAAADGAVALLFEQREVARERGGVAGDVHDPFGAASGQRRDHPGGKTLARRVDENRIYPSERRFTGFNAFGSVAAEKAGVVFGAAVQQRVLPGVFHRLGYDLRTEQAHAGAGRAQTDGACAAVEVEQYVAGRGGRICGCLRVEMFSHFRVDLIEGQRADAENPAAERVGQPFFALEQNAGFTEDDVCPRSVDVQPHAFDGRTACRQLVREPVEGGFVARRHDQNGADIAVLCAAQEDMAQQSPAARLIVGAHAARRQQLGDRLTDGGEGGVLQQTAILSDNAVRAPREKAGAERAGFVLGYRVDRPCCGNASVRRFLCPRIRGPARRCGAVRR